MLIMLSLRFIAVSYKSSTRTRSTGLKKPSKSLKHHSVHLRFPQEAANAARIYGSSITSRLETHYGVLQKVSENLRQYGTDGRMMRLQAMSACPQLVGCLGSILGSHCKFQYLPQCAATAKRKIYAHTLFTQCWRTQTGTTSIAETRVQGS